MFKASQNEIIIITKGENALCFQGSAQHACLCFPWFDGHLWLLQHLPDPWACQTRQGGSQHSLPAALSADAFQTMRRAVCPAQVTRPASQSPTVKTSQSSPELWEAVSWEGGASSILQDGIQPFSALLKFTRISKDFFRFKLMTQPQLKSAVSVYRTFSWKPSRRIALCPLTALKPPFGNFCLTKSELPLCTSEGAFSLSYPAFKKRFSFFWVTRFYRILCRNSRLR